MKISLIASLAALPVSTLSATIMAVPTCDDPATLVGGQYCATANKGDYANCNLGSEQTASTDRKACLDQLAVGLEAVVVADKGTVCSKYKDVIKGTWGTGAMYDKCAAYSQDGLIAECLARMGWRYGIGYPIAKTTSPATLVDYGKKNANTYPNNLKEADIEDYYTSSCTGIAAPVHPPSFDDATKVTTNYTGSGTIFTAPTNCVPACASLCSEADCSDAGKLLSSVQLLAVTFAATFWVAR